MALLWALLHGLVLLYDPMVPTYFLPGFWHLRPQLPSSSVRPPGVPVGQPLQAVAARERDVPPSENARSHLWVGRRCSTGETLLASGPQAQHVGPQTESVAVPKASRKIRLAQVIGGRRIGTSSSRKTLKSSKLKPTAISAADLQTKTAATF